MECDSNNSLSSLASRPFCLNASNSYDEFTRCSEQLIGETLYFSEYDKTKLHPSENVNNERTLFADFGIDDFSNGLYSLDYLLKDETVPSQESRDDLFLECGITTPLGSPGSSLSLDDISYNLLEHIDLDTRHEMEAFYSPNSNDSTSNFKVTNVLSTTESPLSNILRDHMYAKSPESDNILSSPKSIDSGISSSYDETDDTDVFISEQWKVYTSSRKGVSLLESKSPDIDFVVDKQSPNEFLSEIPADTSTVTRTHRYSPYKKDQQQKSAVKKLRRKEHNRKSASKYRTKKKEESGTVFSEAEKLEEKNKDLKVTVEDLQKEINYLKGLMLDVIYARLCKRDNVNLKSLIVDES